jgi:hypothetical protein
VKEITLPTNISSYLHRFYVHSAIEVFNQLAKILFKRVDFLSGLERDNRTCGPSCSEIRFGEVTWKGVRTKTILFHIVT